MARYNESFDEQAVKLLEVLETRLDERVRAIEFFALSVMSSMLYEGENWTHLYTPHMEIRGNRTNDLADAFSITIIPVVTEETRSDYEEFSVEQQGWRAEGLAFQKKWANENWVEPADWDEQVGSISNTITSFNLKDRSLSVEAGPGPYLPSWQSAPSLPNPEIVNMNLLSHPSYAKVLNAGLTTGRLILGDTVSIIQTKQGNRFRLPPVRFHVAHIVVH